MSLNLRDQLWGGNLLEPYLSKFRQALDRQDVHTGYITKLIDRGNFITNGGNCCCCQCGNLEVCYLPYLRNIVESGFYGTKIKYIDLPGIDYGDDPTGPNRYLFMQCTSLKVAKLNNIKCFSWSYQMFDNCPSLEHVEFNSLERMIGNEDRVFVNCPNLKELSLPNIKSINIENRVFFENVGIERVDFPKLEQLVNPQFFVNMEQCKHVNLGKLTMAYAKQNNEWGLPSGCEIKCIDGTYIKE